MNTTPAVTVNLIRGDCVLDGCKAAALSARVAELEAALRIAQNAMRAPIDDWKGELERKALDAARAALAKVQP